MEKIREILNNIKERFSSPLIFSFLCCWIVVNWEIVIALLLHDSKQFEKENCASIFEFIRWKLNNNGSLWKPAACAIAFTILYPFIKNAIRILYSWIEKKSENKILEINKDGKVSVDKYIKMRENYNKRSEILENIISSESVIRTEYEELNTRLYQLEESNNEYSRKLNERDLVISKYRDISILNGYWKCTYQTQQTNEKPYEGSEEILIDNGRYEIINSLGQGKHTFDIQNFYFDKNSKVIFFVKNRISKSDPLDISGNNLKHNINVLRITSEDILTGRENDITTISYQRKPTNIN